jgi:hypothetical protein
VIEDATPASLQHHARVSSPEATSEPEELLDKITNLVSRPYLIKGSAFDANSRHRAILIPTEWNNRLEIDGLRAIVAPSNAFVSDEKGLAGLFKAVDVTVKRDFSFQLPLKIKRAVFGDKQVRGWIGQQLDKLRVSARTSEIKEQSGL